MQRKITLAVLTGVLLFLSFPKFGNAFFAWFSLVPLFYALKESSLRDAFRTGFLAGMVGNTGVFYWIAFVTSHYGGLPFYAGIAVMLLLAAYLSIYTGLFAAGMGYFQKRWNRPLLLAPLLWTILEFARAHLFTGFPWESIGYSQYLNKTVIQTADVAGVYGVSFLVVTVNWLLFEILDEFHSEELPLKKVSMACCLLLSVFLYGRYRIVETAGLLAGAPSGAVSLVQGDIDQNSKWDSLYQAKTVGIYRQLSLEHLPAEDGVIIWPETAAPFFFGHEGPLREKIIDLARAADRSLLFGSPHYEKKDDTVIYRNSAFLVKPDGAVAGRYDKVHLVPYGEYVPLKQLFPFVEKLVTGVGDFRSGKDFIPLTDGRRRYGVLICYEGIFPEGSNTYKRYGTDLLVNITNDAWFGTTSAPYQHLSMTVFRAVETRLFLVRAANTGISAIIDPTGSIVSQTALFARGALQGNVKFIDKKTFYAAYGDIFVYICLITLVIYEIRKRRRREHAGRN